VSDSPSGTDLTALPQSLTRDSLKSWRGIATRYDKHARNYRAGLVLASIILFWLR
jgi:transposase